MDPKNYRRKLAAPEQSFFLFGPRGVGKSTWLKNQLEFSINIDLLNHNDYFDLRRDPHLLAAKLAHLPPESWVCLDEIQKIPELLDEVHALIENQKLKFALSGSSARKLKRGGANLLGGRAITRHMESFVSAEMKNDFNLDAACAWGTMPLVVQSKNLKKDILSSYVHTYLKEEIQAEGLARNLGSFGRFLEIAGLINGQQINVENLARDAGISRAIIQEYLSILEDTLLCHRLKSYRPKVKVRESAQAKWYWFDAGVARACAGLLSQPENPEWLGFALETLIYHELRVYNHISGKNHELAYYKTPTSEIDFVIETQKSYGSERAHVICLEIKWAQKWKNDWENSIRSLAHTGKITVDRMIGVYRGKERLTFDQFEVWPIQDFLAELWNGKVF